MILLLSAILFFLLTHSLPAMPRLRARLVGLLGERGYLTAYGALSLLSLLLVGLAFAGADRMALWETRTWMRHAALAVMLPACLLLAVTFTTPNPYSIGIGARGFDPAKPGPLRLTRHPLLHALALWAGVHILPNGDLPSLVMFGFFLLLALAGFPMMAAKRKTPPFPPGRLRFSDVGWWRLGLGLGLYALLLWAHPYVIGVDPLG